MSTCDPMSFKISSIGIRAHTWMTFELYIWVILGFPFFGLEAIFWSFFFFLFGVDSRFSNLINVGDL